MSENNELLLKSYYDYVQFNASLRTNDHARYWSTGVLKTLGLALDGKTKRALAKALPQELADSVTGVFWLLHFRDPVLTSDEFCRRVARRSGNSDAEFAMRPTLAVFGGLKMWIDDELNDRLTNTLSPEVRSMWESAQLIDVKS